jgi:RNA polymerase sigma-70 factor, ECF subfamily
MLYGAMDPKLRKEFLKAYDDYADAIYRYCYFRVYSKNIAEDLVQETFMKTWQYLMEHEKIGNIRYFLYKVSRNLIVDLKRKQSRGYMMQNSEYIFDQEDSREPEYIDIADIEKKMLFDEVMVILEKISPKQKEIVLLRFVDGLAVKEIAEMFQTNSNNISVKLYKAIKKIKHILEIKNKGISAK